MSNKISRIGWCYKCELNYELLYWEKSDHYMYRTKNSDKIKTPDVLTIPRLIVKTKKELLNSGECQCGNNCKPIKIKIIIKEV